MMDNTILALVDIYACATAALRCVRFIAGRVLGCFAYTCVRFIGVVTQLVVMCVLCACICIHELLQFLTESLSVGCQLVVSF